MGELFFFGKKYETGVQYKTELPRSASGVEIGPLAMQQINAVLMKWHKNNIAPRWGYAYRDYFPETWDWTWQPEGNKKITITDARLEKPVVLQGTLTKRIQTFYYKVYGQTLPSEYLTEIGNAVKLDNPELTVSYWDITNDFNWENGQFGDYGSCFWTTDRRVARNHIKNHGGYAIRFFKDEKYSESNGIARAFLVPYRLSDGTETWLVTNGYGMTTQAICRFFGTEMGKHYKIIGLTVDGSWDGVFYINAEGKGYIVGDIEKVNVIDYIDLKWNLKYSSDSDYSSEQHTFCAHCDVEIDRNDAPYRDGNYYCRSCYYDMYTICGHCDTEVASDTTTYVDSMQYSVCERCLNRWYRMSDINDEYYPRDEINHYNVLDENHRVNGVNATLTQLQNGYVRLDYPELCRGCWTLEENAHLVSVAGHADMWVHNRDTDPTEPLNLTTYETPDFFVSEVATPLPVESYAEWLRNLTAPPPPVVTNVEIEMPAGDVTDFLVAVNNDAPSYWVMSQETRDDIMQRLRTNPVQFHPSRWYEELRTNPGDLNLFTNDDEDNSAE